MMVSARLRAYHEAKARAGLALLRHGLGVAAREDAVLEGEVAHPQRREQVPVLGRHRRFSMDVPGPDVNRRLAEKSANPGLADR
jgi:hypothetical protein